MLKYAVLLLAALAIASAWMLPTIQSPSQQGKAAPSKLFGVGESHQLNAYDALDNSEVIEDKDINPAG